MRRGAVLPGALCSLAMIAGCSGGHPTVNRVRPAVSPSKRASGSPTTSCVRVRGAAGRLEKVYAAVGAPEDRRVPFYFLAAVAGEVAIRLPIPVASGPSQSGSVSFTVQRDGTARAVRRDSAGDQRFDSLIVAAIREAGMFRQFAVQLQDIPRLPIRVHLRMWTQHDAGDTLSLAMADSIRDTDSLTNSESEKLPWSLAGNPKPQYPAAALPGYNRGEVTAHIVMNEAGRVDSTGFAILHASHRVFSDAVVAVMPFWRVQPAVAGGCAIRSSVNQQFEFMP